MAPVPATRIITLDARPLDPAGAYVLYWMVSNRRLEWNYALDRALEIAREFDRPVLILEALRVGYRWASDRHHAFALQGMAEHAAHAAASGISYYPYVEPEAGAGAGLLEALAAGAVAVVTDHYPAFFLPRMVRAAASRAGRRFEAVDSCGLLPLVEGEKAHTAAYPFRRHLQKRLPDHLLLHPAPEPLRAKGLPAPAEIPHEILGRWPAASPTLLSADASALAALPIDHAVGPVAARGGRATARAALDRFLAEGLHRYASDRNHPDAEAASGLSPWLHWGHLSAHEIFHEVARMEEWTPARLSERVDGRRSGWWGMGEDAEAFLDQLVTWRELGYGFCHHEPDYATYASLPGWARATLEDHAADPRPATYTFDELETAATQDELWNAAQRQLLRDGFIHNYLRMLWGKKILEWSAHPREALDTMLALNDRWSVDGRDPNSYSGIFWVLGRFDRGWPERPVFGKVRSMSSERTRKKVWVEEYLRRYKGRSG